MSLIGSNILQGNAFPVPKFSENILKAEVSSLTTSNFDNANDTYSKLSLDYSNQVDFSIDVDKETRETVISLIDRTTKEKVMSIPSESIQKIRQQIHEMMSGYSPGSYIDIKI